MGALPSQYAKSLSRLARRPSNELTQLLRLWPKARTDFETERRRLLQEIPNDDPLRSAVDLLNPIRCASDETLHSQALAYALDPAQAHGLGRTVLVTMLRHIQSSYPKGGAARILKRVQKQSVHLTVTPEYRFRLEGIRNRSVARSDIWIQAKVRSRSALVIIENKIGASESDGQLGWYEHKVDAWCKKHGARSLLIFLTRDGQSPRTARAHKWIPLSYLGLAAILRKALLQCQGAEGAEWLRLYIASITRGVLGMRVERPQSVLLADLRKYLGDINA